MPRSCSLQVATDALTLLLGHSCYRPQQILCHSAFTLASATCTLAQWHSYCHRVINVCTTAIALLLEHLSFRWHRDIHVSHCICAQHQSSLLHRLNTFSGRLQTAANVWSFVITRMIKRQALLLCRGLPLALRPRHRARADMIIKVVYRINEEEDVIAMRNTRKHPAD